MRGMLAVRLAARNVVVVLFVIAQSRDSPKTRKERDRKLKVITSSLQLS